MYLDYHATTPVDPRVVEAMLPYFTDIFGNPASSGHAWGWQAQNAVEVARGEVASLIGAQARDITFTSGATESNNFALKGLSRAVAPGRRHLVVSAIEHKSVLEGAMAQAASGWRVTVVPVRPDGRLDLDGLAAAVGPETALVSVMAASNEIGVTQPLADIAAIAHDAGALLHTDAAQAAGKIPIDVAAQGIDFLSLTGHKMYGPKGAGAIYIRRPLKLDPLLVGGGQERGVRSGTLNVPGIVGLGRAAAIAQHDMAAEAARLAALRNRLLAGLEDRVGGIAVNGSMTHRLPHNLNVSFAGVEGDALLASLGDIAVSSGSACSSSSEEPSHVLRAILGERVPSACIRFGLGRFTTDAEIDYAIEKFSAVVTHLRRTAPVSASTS